MICELGRATGQNLTRLMQPLNHSKLAAVPLVEFAPMVSMVGTIVPVPAVFVVPCVPFPKFVMSFALNQRTACLLTSGILVAMPPANCAPPDGKMYDDGN